MNELGAELDRYRNARQAVREAARADAVARLDHQHRAAGARERVCRGEAGGTGADYEDVDLNLRMSQGAMMSSAVMASSVAEIGWLMNTEGSPWLIDSARRN